MSACRSVCPQRVSWKCYAVVRVRLFTVNSRAVKYGNLVVITAWVQKSYLTSSSFRFSINWLGWGSITVKIHVQITVIRYSYRVETVGQVY